MAADTGHRATRAGSAPILHNQRGVVLDRAIPRGAVNVVICRLHFQRTTWE
jgi:hypothetical protein